MDNNLSDNWIIHKICIFSKVQCNLHYASMQSAETYDDASKQIHRWLVACATGTQPIRRIASILAVRNRHFKSNITDAATSRVKSPGSEQCSVRCDKARVASSSSHKRGTWRRRPSTVRKKKRWSVPTAIASYRARSPW